jgi:hypothetical protein
VQTGDGSIAGISACGVGNRRGIVYSRATKHGQRVIPQVDTFPVVLPHRSIPGAGDGTNARNSWLMLSTLPCCIGPSPGAGNGAIAMNPKLMPWFLCPTGPTPGAGDGAIATPPPMGKVFVPFALIGALYTSPKAT